MASHRDSKVIKIVLAIFFICVLIYALYEARGILSGPVVYIPAETLVSNEERVMVRGQAERIVELRMNGKTISVTEEGTFEEPFLLASGTNRIMLDAKDARGRTTSRTLDIVYMPQ